MENPNLPTHYAFDGTNHYGGMTKREYAAIHICSTLADMSRHNVKETCTQAITIADELLKQLDK